jgi:DNA-binding Lrp family transcriptional regulator
MTVMLPANTETFEASNSVNASRQALLAELESLGINVKSLQSLTVDQLSILLYSLNKIATENSMPRGSRNRSNTGHPALSAVDKKLLRSLLESKGRVSSLRLSRDLQIPLSTVQRRRKRLEKEFIEHSYSLKYNKFSKRHVTFVISLGAGDRSEIAREILQLKGVIMIERVFGNNLDLKVEVILETNAELSALNEKIRSIQGIRSVTFFEFMELLKKNAEVDSEIIEPELTNRAERSNDI